ncbi:hypothetical protein TcCL_NonESM10615 [Trypanosoma cruzi]|uniref:Uncharacterized protein n=1 Tax=Trypanosoma cruzi (strain CL Brener) TaxID=353153 RepID=Q4DPK1_TRYCC|nr:hypothetical protein Tc00.1047053506613.70 [Trypanosoma cruzi]EAN94454.1 hypothetical protein Tc00.1047053506613.70 [Trypanosoma cruzi]RNC39964.1 hypothetical protein TcCL_NonESM10615 [Trypanosoma cruzi]|eukprot:XP_816305.1 hypothetical protein [Trypanosoma cruzi strain CL Brener]
MPADDVTSGGMPPMISGQTIIGMGGHERQQRRQQQEQLSLCLLREAIIPPATADCAIVTLHARRGCVNTSCSLQRLKRCLTPSTECIDVGRASAVRGDHSDVRVTESQHVCCDVVAWHLHTHTQRLHPSLLCSTSAGVATHTDSSKITSPSTIQNQHRHPSRRNDLGCQHGLPVALPSTPKHGTVHALIFLACSQPFASHILRWADVHKSTQQKATVIAQALATSVGVCMDPLLTRAGRQPAAGALVPVHRLQHGKEKTAYSSCTYSHQQHQHAGRQPSFLSTSRNAEK